MELASAADLTSGSRTSAPDDTITKLPKHGGKRAVADISEKRNTEWMRQLKFARNVTISLGIVGALALGFGLGTSVDRWGFPRAVPSMPFEGVLDGDTIIDRGRAIHISDLDAPELGPWAQCWAEAALAGKAKSELESTLAEDRGWHIVEVRRSAAGRISGRVLDREGYSIADDMSVSGAAARTANRWNWCKPDPKMRSPLDGEHPPHGPNLWWPAGTKYDPRAAD